MHDPLLLPYVQTMYGKLMMNFVEPLLIYDKQNGESVIEHIILLNLCFFI